MFSKSITFYSLTQLLTNNALGKSTKDKMFLKGKIIPFCFSKNNKNCHLVFEDVTGKIACYLQYDDRNLHLIDQDIIVFQWKLCTYGDDQNYLELHEFALEKAVSFTDDVDNTTSYRIKNYDFHFDTSKKLSKYQKNILFGFNEYLLVNPENALILSKNLSSQFKEPKSKVKCVINLIGKLTWISNIFFDNKISKINQIFFMTFCHYEEESIDEGDKTLIFIKCSLNRYLWLQNLMKVGEVYLIENLVLDPSSIPNNIKSNAVYSFTKTTDIVLVSSESVKKGVLDNLVYFGFDSYNGSSDKKLKILESKFNKLCLNEQDAAEKKNEPFTYSIDSALSPISSQVKLAQKEILIEKYLKHRDKTLELFKQRVNGFAPMLDAYENNDFVVTLIEKLHTFANGTIVNEQTLILVVEINQVFSLKISFSTEDTISGNNSKTPLNFTARMMLDTCDASDKLTVMLRNEKVKQCFKSNFWSDIEAMAREYMKLTGEACVIGINIDDINKKNETVKEGSFLQAGEILFKINKNLGEYIMENILTKSISLRTSSGDITYYNKASDDDEDYFDSENDLNVESSKDNTPTHAFFDNVSDNTCSSYDDVLTNTPTSSNGVSNETPNSSDGSEVSESIDEEDWKIYQDKIMAETFKNRKLLLVLKVVSFSILDDRQKCNFLLKNMADNLEALKSTNNFHT